MREFYVYLLFGPDGVVRYVGKGRGYRWAFHERHTKNRALKAIVKSGGLTREKVKEGLSEQEAFDLERSLIASLGRIKDGGPLVNLTAGGQGTTDCPTRSRSLSRALRGRKFSKEWRQKLSKAAKARDRSAGYSQEHADAIRKSLVAFWAKRRRDAQRSGRPVQRLGWERKGG